MAAKNVPISELVALRVFFYAGALADFSADLDDGHIPARRTTNCVF